MSLAFFKHKTFWLSLAHIAIASASIGASVMFPASIPLIIGTQALVNGIIPSPISLKPTPLPPVHPLSIPPVQSLPQSQQTPNPIPGRRFF